MIQQEDQGQCSSQSQAINNFETYQEQFLLQQQNNTDDIFTGGGGGRGSLNNMFPGHEVSPILQPWCIPQVVQNQQYQYDHHHNSFVIPPPPPPPSQAASPYASLFNRRVPNSLQFAYDHGCSSSEQLRIISDTFGQHGSVSAPFGFQTELGKMTAQEIMEAKALAASKSHSEAERRRRERINNHLAKLRSLLPSTTKTDKASLLAEVIQHVKELKRQTSLIAETSPVPTECDELIVDTADEDGKFVIRASLCCDDRSDLLPELIKTLKALRLRTLKADITTLGGRVKNVLFITGEDIQDSTSSSGGEGEEHNQQQQLQYCISSIQEALKAVMEKISVGDESASGSVKRQRTNIISIS